MDFHIEINTFSAGCNSTDENAFLEWTERDSTLEATKKYLLKLPKPHAHSYWLPFNFYWHTKRERQREREREKNPCIVHQTQKYNFWQVVMLCNRIEYFNMDSNIIIQHCGMIWLYLWEWHPYYRIQFEIPLMLMVFCVL